MGQLCIRKGPKGEHSQAQRRRLQVRKEMMALSLGKAQQCVELDLA